MRRASKHSLHFVGLGAGILLTSFQVGAAEADSGTLRRILVEDASIDQLGLDRPASSASRLNLTPLETPANVEILSGESIVARGDSRFVDAISRATGITNVSSPGTGNSLTARGFSGHTSVMTLYDGMRFFAAASTLTFPFDTWSIDRIEVLHGPASVLYGEGSLGGAINVIPRKPSRQESYQARFSVADHDTYHLGLGAGGPLGERFSYRTDVSYRQSENWFENGDAESLAISGGLRWDLTDSLSATLMYDYGDQDKAPYYGVPLINGRLNKAWIERNFNFGDAVMKWRDDLTRLNLTWSVAEGVALTNDTYYISSNRHWRNAEAYAYVAATGLVNRSDFLEIYHNQIQRGNRTNLVVNHSLFGLQNDVSIGFDINSVRFLGPSNSPFRGSDAIDPDDFVPGQFNSPDATRLTYRAETQQYSIFAENRLKVTDRWALVGGLRYDDIQVDRDQFFDANSFEKGYSPLSWRIGSVFDITRTFVVFGQYASNSEHVSTLITSSVAQAPYRLTRGELYEVGVKQIFADGLGQWTLTAYDLTKYDILSRDQDNPNVQQQIGARSARGLEFAVALALGESWAINANVAALDARYDDFKEVTGGQIIVRDGKTPTGVPERTANAYVTWDFLPDWQAGAGWRYVGKRYANNANTLTAKAYNVADLNVRWQAMDEMGLTLRLDNAFDKVYVTSTSQSQWSIEKPRTLELMVDFRY
ncbi:TonB-dependent receptor [Steroidobacter cummioxidans]|uniref:TonB-dependent receptor n=1 Tax=Steroidobacter cummioxidans TaxID=1803913 RepID=UPI000E31317A|nr:TonB-dependent siderophore receptor [Steroidobacter cummioxidans]